MIKQLIYYREYTTHIEQESKGNTTYSKKVKDYEDYEDFIRRVTGKANLLNDEQTVISISYPNIYVAVITYKGI